MTYQPPPEYPQYGQPQYEPPPRYSHTGPYYPTQPPVAPQYAPPPVRHNMPRKKRGKGPFVVLGIILALGVAGIVFAVATSGNSGKSPGTPHAPGFVSNSHTINVLGQLQLIDTSGEFSSISTDSSGSCTGTGGYNDITSGGEVVISDDSGKTLAITQLDDGIPSGPTECDFAFNASVPAGKAFYGIAVGHRGTVKFTEAEMNANPQLTLGKLMASVALVNDEIVSGCCMAELSIQREVGPDISVFAARRYDPSTTESGLTYPATLYVEYVKTYDAVDNGAYEVTCTRCGSTIDVEVEDA